MKSTENEVNTRNEKIIFKFNGVSYVIISLLAEWVREGRASGSKTIFFQLIGFEKWFSNLAAQKVYRLFHCCDRR